MFIIKVIDGQAVGQMIDYRDVFGRSVPTDEQLAAQQYMRVSLHAPYNALTEKLVSSAPVVSGDFVVAVAAATMTAEEIQAAKDSAMANIRAQRNQMLAATDWRYRRDLTTTPEWDAYCQALRDLPATIQAEGTDPRTFTDWPRDPDWKPMGMSMA